MTWTFIWMAVVLKIPIAALLAICWWAVREEPEPAAEAPEGGGGGGTGHPPRPRKPRPPRRGAHGEPAAQPPPRVRAAARDSVRSQ